MQNVLELENSINISVGQAILELLSFLDNLLQDNYVIFQNSVNHHIEMAHKCCASMFEVQFSSTNTYPNRTDIRYPQETGKNKNLTA